MVMPHILFELRPLALDILTLRIFYFYPYKAIIEAASGGRKSSKHSLMVVALGRWQLTVIVQRCTRTNKRDVPPLQDVSK